jgi:hypothetical protein
MTTTTEPKTELDKTLNELEDEVIAELDDKLGKVENPNRLFSSVFPYEVYIPIKTDKDALTEVIIRTYSEDFHSGRNEQDVLFQIETAKPYVGDALSTRMIRYALREIGDVPIENVELTYTGKPVIKKMTDERLKDFKLTGESDEY